VNYKESNIRFFSDLPRLTN